MKKFHLTPVVLSLVLASAAALNAATSDPVGAVAQEIAAGNHLISVPFQKPIEYQGAVVSVTGAEIGLAGVPSLPANAYVQVLDGPAAGAIASVASSTATSVTVDAAIAGLAVANTVAVRAHVTLEDVAGYVQATDGDLITLYNSDTTTISVEYITGLGWYDGTNDLVLNDTILYPGEGLVFFATSARTATYYGSVSTAALSAPVPGSSTITLIGTLDPIAGQVVENMFPLANDGDLLTAYVTVGGVLQADYSAEYISGLGWYDGANDLIVNSNAIPTGGAVVLQGVANGVAAHAAAY